MQKVKGGVNNQSPSPSISNLMVMQKQSSSQQNNPTAASSASQPQSNMQSYISQKN